MKTTLPALPDHIQPTYEHLERYLPHLWPAAGSALESRLHAHFPALYEQFNALYHHRSDMFYHLLELLQTVFKAAKARPDELIQLDQAREEHIDYFSSNRMVGAVGYVDLYAGNLQGLRAKLPALKQLGVTYLHLMPLFTCPENNSDGGYAVSDFRRVRADLGTMSELAELTAELRADGISVCLDYILNHTSDEHDWAKRALAGEKEYQDFFWMFENRDLPDQYEHNLREIFPEQAPGNFLWNETLQRWVWTTFNHFQWDLNYTNPAVLNAMLGEMLFLANQGVEVLRLDAVAFIWKQLGTPCENLPQAHQLVRVLNAAAKIAAPALTFKSEAIVHPDDIIKYIDVDESQLSYNPTFMALLWEALATRDVRMLQYAMSKRFDLPPHCAWINYIRVHDDIGWSFADEDAIDLGIQPFDHRQFLNQFYTGQFEGSFARGVPFNYNPITKDMRISGTTASLCGLESALDDAELTQEAIARILLMHGIILACEGIPLIYLGDEIATLNDYTYEKDPHQVNDSRWVHRPRYDNERFIDAQSGNGAPAQVYQGLQTLIQARKQLDAVVAEGEHTDFTWAGNVHVLKVSRGHRFTLLTNFSEHPQTIELPAHMRRAQDTISGTTLSDETHVTLAGLQQMWLIKP